MKYTRFEELPVWQSAIELAQRVYAMTRDSSFKHSGDLRDQLRRAALSVSNNIAEGYERGTTAELLAFLYIARGSAGEVRSMLHFIEHLPQTSILSEDITSLRALAESCSRQLYAWAEKLKKDDIKGQRHLTETLRGQYEQNQLREAFLQQIAENLHKAHPDLYPDPAKGK